jgi:biopolymer transport protein ExbB/TolQ
MSRRDQVRLARLACERKAAEVCRQLGRGKAGLATVAASAAFLGIFLTVFSITFVCFGNQSGEVTSVRLWTTGCLGREQWTTIFGLGVSLGAFTGYRFISAAVASADAEMRIAILDLERTLLTFRQNDLGKPNTCSAT